MCCLQAQDKLDSTVERSKCNEAALKSELCEAKKKMEAQSISQQELRENLAKVHFIYIQMQCYIHRATGNL